MTYKSSKQKKTINYKKAGVDTEAGYELVKKIKPILDQTKKPEVLSKIGSFSAISRIPSKFDKPLIVTCTDGVGTKIEIAKELGLFSGIGIDLVGMCVNDLITCGAEPLLFLDYYVTDKLRVEIASKVIEGIANGCKEANCSLVGGETAEHPNSFPKRSFDLAGFAVGIVEETKIIKSEAVKEGDVLIGLASSGFHSNGFSLIREVIRKNKISLYTKIDGSTLGENLLTPTRIYVKPILDLLSLININAIVHITGGGFYENVPRILKKDLKATIQFDFLDWEKPSLFQWIKKEANISLKEMLSTFNCGVGLIICVEETNADKALRNLNKDGEVAKVIGKIEKKGRNDQQVEFV